MGMYTELVINARIKGDVPPEVIANLKVMCGLLGEDVWNRTDHPFSAMNRAPMMLRCNSYYFVPRSTHLFEFDSIAQEWMLLARCDLKNYEGEIEAFIDWLTPHLANDDGDHLGYKRYEEDERPTLLFHPNKWESV